MSPVAIRRPIERKSIGRHGPNRGEAVRRWFYERVAPPYAPPDDEARTLAQAALFRRDRGDSYATIGKAFGISKGKAHHFVGWAQDRRVVAAQEVLRPPGQLRSQLPGRHRELLARLRLDFSRVRRVIDQRIDFSEGGKGTTNLRRRLDRIETEFADGCAALELSRASGQRLGGKGAKRPAEEGCRRVETSFTKLLRMATEADPVLRQGTCEQHVLAVFGRDLEELASLLGIEFQASAELPDRRSGIRSVEETAPAEPAARLDAKARRERDRRIVMARLGGAKVRELAEENDLTPRQIHRIMANYRESSSLGPVVAKALDDGVATLNQALRELDRKTAESSDAETRFKLIEERTAHLAAAAVRLRRAGLFSPEMYATRKRDDHQARAKLTADINHQLREWSKKRKIDPEVADEVIELVVKVASVDVFFEGGDIVHA